METESLTSYNSNGDVHLMQKSVDKSVLNNGLDTKTKDDLSDEQGDKICVEDKSNEPNDVQRENSDKKDEDLESDVEEEEEHVPLNLETTSDLEKSDDEIDESTEQNNCDSDNEEKEADESVNEVSDPVEENDQSGKQTEENEAAEEPICVTNEEVSPSDETDPLEVNTSDQNEKNQSEEETLENGEGPNQPDENSADSETVKSNDETNTVKGDQSDDNSIDEVKEGTKPDANKEESVENKEDVNEDKADKDASEEKAGEVSAEDKEDKASTGDKADKDATEKNDEDMDTKEKDEDEKEKEIENIEDESEEKQSESDKQLEKKSENASDLGNCSLLKETLLKKPESKEPECEEDRDDDMDEALFDPSLLCPDIFMEVDEAPVITTNDAPPPPQDGNKSPLLYEPIFSTFVDEMTGAEVSFNLSAEEENLRQETFGESNPVQFTKIHCTACNVHLGSALDGQGNRFVHPLLKVLICKNCYHFYTSGEFEKDEDGSELYCRWCGQGGQVMCCSNCEMVFCKKCIRINFDKKKLSEIRDSDDWLCFRCNPSQLTFQRIHCAEFMEYVRREISRAATLENATSFMTKDNSECCLPQKKKATEPPSGEPKKKRKRTTADPDYDPFKDREEVESPQPSTSGYKIIPPKSATPTPKIQPSNDANKNMAPNAVNSTYIISTPTFKPRVSTFQQSRPRVQVIAPANMNPAQRPKVSGPGYIKILPGGIRIPGNMPTPRNAYQPRQVHPVITQNAPQTPPGGQAKQQQQQQQQQGRNLAPAMKHEWFEKTVRAAARVNSNLSYTLTQLNRAQANATNVEALAVVHNKLQEILSTSINSLIQIRKNLRTEFIAGIKNIRFPSTAPKPATPTPAQKPAAPSTAAPSSQDDDIIFISPPTSPVPPPLKQISTPTTSSINLPSTLSVLKKTPSTPNASTPPPKLTPTITPNKSADNNNVERPKTFLRVKSLTALQNVTSECITIPDDPLPPPPPLAPIQSVKNDFKAKNVEAKEEDVVEIIDDEKEAATEKVPPLVNGDDKTKSISDEVTFNLKDPHSKDLQAILRGFKVVLEKSTEIDELARKEILSVK